MKQIPLYKMLIFKSFSKKWADGKLQHIREYLPQNGSLLDLGAGKGAVSYALKQEGYDVCSVDIKDLSYTDAVQPILYDGKNLPFAEKSFDCGLLLTILHHTPEPDIVLKEAARVCKTLIVIEDVYTNRLQKHLTWFFDSLFNFEFIGHPHTNRTDKQWKQSFSRLGFTLEAAQSRQVLGFCTQVAYRLHCS